MLLRHGLRQSCDCQMREKQLFIKKCTAVSYSTDNDDITNINNENEESENVRVNLNSVTNGLNAQNENIECGNQEKINDEES